MHSVQMDIMAYIDDEPEGISMIQKDSRLAGNVALADCRACALMNCVTPSPRASFVSVPALIFVPAAAAGCDDAEARS